MLRRLLALLAFCTLLRAAESPSVPDLLRESLLDFERYAESVWHEEGYFGDGVSDGNAGIRGTCGVALVCAVLAREFPESPERARRVARTIAALRFAASTHRAIDQAKCTDGKTWGYGWQTSLWSGSLGFACALLGDQAPPDLVLDCQKIMAAEADRLAAIPPPSGNRGDSKAEENAWNSNVLALAAAWLANDPRAATWTDGARRYLANTYTVPEPGDDPLREWLTTTNLLPSFAMENHGFFHPTYQMVSGMSLGDSLLMAQMLHPATAAQLRPFAEHNVLPVWRCLEQVVLDSGELAYPSGLDWSLHGYGQISYYAWLATHFQDANAQWATARLIRLIRQRQTVNGDGRVTGESCPNGFYREAVAARRLAIALLHYRQVKTVPEPQPPPPFVAHLPDVKLLLQRSPQGFLAISYGSRVMGVVHPTAAAYPDAPYVTTPLVPGLLTVNGVLPRQADLQDVATSADGVAATLDLSDRFLSVCRVRVVATGDSLALLELPGGDVPSQPPAVFPVGIENHPLTGPGRQVEWPGGTREVAQRSGTRFEVTEPVVCVAARLGMVAGPAGRFVYTAPKSYNRDGAAQDTLAYQPKTSTAPRYTILLPGADLATAERVQQSVVYQATGDTVTLRYRTPGGKEVSLELANSLPAPAFVRLPVACEVHVANHHQDFPGTNMVDGDTSTFWVSSRDGVQVLPGNGPTPERPERVELTFPRSRVGGVIVVPRPRYGPKTLRIELGGKEIFVGTMGDEPLPVRLPAAIEADSLVLTITASHDPLHPNSSRNVQIAEIALLKAP